LPTAVAVVAVFFFDRVSVLVDTTVILGSKSELLPTEDFRITLSLGLTLVGEDLRAREVEEGFRAGAVGLESVEVSMLEVRVLLFFGPPKSPNDSRSISSPRPREEGTASNVPARSEVKESQSPAPNAFVSNELDEKKDNDIGIDPDELFLTLVLLDVDVDGVIASLDFDSDIFELAVVVLVIVDFFWIRCKFGD